MNLMLFVFQKIWVQRGRSYPLIMPKISPMFISWVRKTFFQNESGKQRIGKAAISPRHLFFTHWHQFYIDCILNNFPKHLTNFQEV